MVRLGFANLSLGRGDKFKVLGKSVQKHDFYLLRFSLNTSLRIFELAALARKLETAQEGVKRSKSRLLLRYNTIGDGGLMSDEVKWQIEKATGAVNLYIFSCRFSMTRSA